jgi:RNA polymerase sigma factor (sigma-70 family)
MFLRRKAIDPLTDEDLTARIRAGDQASLGVLWDRYAHLLFGVGMKYLKDTERSKDSVLDLFTTLPGLLEKHEVKHFRSWVHTVMRNRCLMELRGSERGAALEPALVADDVELAHETALHEATLQQLERAIETLKDGQRECIRLFYLQRMSYAQVSERTGLDLEQVRSNLQNGRRNLRIQLERHTHDETH